MLKSFLCVVYFVCLQVHISVCGVYCVLCVVWLYLLRCAVLWRVGVCVLALACVYISHLVCFELVSVSRRAMAVCRCCLERKMALFPLRLVAWMEAENSSSTCK